MNKKLWSLFTVLILVIMLLAGTSSYYFFKNRALTGSKQETSSTTDLTATPTAEATALAASSSPTAAAVAASTTNRPSNPANTYVIKQGETLYSIAIKNDLTQAELAQANGIADANKIKAGQTLVIPQNGQIAYTVDQAKAASLQKSSNTAKYQFRLDPVLTVQADISPCYGLTNTDAFTLAAKDLATGAATVNLTKDGQKYTITLSQPVDKGASGIWAITSVAPSK